MTAFLQVQDAAVRSVLTTLDTHIQAMFQAGMKVEDVNLEVHRHFQAACSTAYQNKIHEWQDQYRQLKTAYQTFQDHFSSGHQQIRNAHTEALGASTKWSGSNLSLEVEHGLNPR
ncbi:hypothetical protein ACFYUY_39390 [Kitasatospora sp. NPDC004745]|uniref:hypothetical protein n=1 Tax=unclassified Kitasatospora TaxID=2633591 RepID=UPI0033DD118A